MRPAVAPETEARTRSSEDWPSTLRRYGGSLVVVLLFCAGMLATSHQNAGAAASSDLQVAQDLLRNCQLQLAAATTSGERTRANQCIAIEQKVIAKLTATPAPSTPPATTAPPSTTAPATTVPPVSTAPPVTTPPPSSSAPPPATCMPNPHLCGYPDETNTGTIPGSTLAARSGTVVLNTGAVYENIALTGCIQVKGYNVTIRNVRIVQTCSYAAIDLEFPNNGALIQDVEIDMSHMPDPQRLNLRAITTMDNMTHPVTITRVWWHDGSDCVHYGGSASGPSATEIMVTITDSFCEIPVAPAGYCCPDPHLDGFQSSGGSGVLIYHNTIRNPNDQTSAIINGTTPGVSAPQYNVRIIGNLMAGGGWTVYCNAHYASTVPTIEFRDNVFARTYYHWSNPQSTGSGYYGPMTDCGSVPGVGTTQWDGDGSVPPAVAGKAGGHPG